MADKLPLVLASGNEQQLQSADKLHDGSRHYVRGPASVTSTAPVVFDGTTGDLIKAITGLSGNVLPKYDGTTFVDSDITDDGSTITVSPNKGLFCDTTQTWEFGDFSVLANGVYFSLVNDGLNVGAPKGLIALGDINDTANSTKLLIDDNSHAFDVTSAGISTIGDVPRDNYIRIDSTTGSEDTGIFFKHGNKVDVDSTYFNVFAQQFNYVALSANTYGVALTLANPSFTVASAGNQYFSPAMAWNSQGWRAGSGGASERVDFLAFTKPIQGAFHPTGEWTLQSNVNLGTPVTRFKVDTDGVTYLGNMSLPVKVMPFTGQASWIDMPTGGASGIGNGGAGSNAWIAYASGSGNWFTNSTAGDICYRNSGGILLGNGTGSNPFTLEVRNDKVTFGDARNIVFNTSTGTKIGEGTTQKFAFHNSTPVVQRSGAAQAAVAATASTNVAPFGFTTSAQADAIVTLVNEIRASLVEKGLIKGSA